MTQIQILNKRSKENKEEEQDEEEAVYPHEVMACRRQKRRSRINTVRKKSTFRPSPHWAVTWGCFVHLIPSVHLMMRLISLLPPLKEGPHSLIGWGEVWNLLGSTFGFLFSCLFSCADSATAVLLSLPKLFSGFIYQQIMWRECTNVMPDGWKHSNLAETFLWCSQLRQLFERRRKKNFHSFSRKLINLQFHSPSPHPQKIKKVMQTAL